MANYNFVAKDTGTDCGAIQGTGTDFSAISAGVIGIWDVDNGKYLDGSSDILGFMNTQYVDDVSGDTATNSVNIPMNYIYPNRFQIVQGRTTGAPLATSILFGKDVTHLEYRPYVAGVKHKHVYDVVDAAATTTVNSIKVITKAYPTAYYTLRDSAYPNISYRSGEIFNFEYSGATAKDTIGAGLVTAGTKDRHPFTVSYNTGTDKITIEAKEVGYIFDVVVNATSDGNDLSLDAVTTGEKGEGVADVVQGLEKKSLANLGYHNRIWLPMSTSNELMSNGHSVNGYDLIQIKVKGENGNTYAHSLEGKMRGDVTINMWWDEAWTDGASTLDTANPFGATIAAGTGVAYQFQNGVGIVDPS